MADTFDIKRGDTLPVFRATLYEDDDLVTPVDLGAVQEVHIKVGNIGDVLIDKAVTILSPASDGRVEVQFTEAETAAQVGEFKIEIEVTWNDGSIGTYPKTGFKNFIIHPDLDGP